MAVCVQPVVNNGPDLPPQAEVLILDRATTNIATCQFVLVTGSEFGVAASSGLPPAEDIAAVWSVGFSMVVACFLIGRGVGAALEFIRKG